MLLLTLRIDHTHVSTTPYITATALEDVKNSIQELRSILLHARGGVLDREPNELETDQRGRDSRWSGVIAGEIDDDTGSIGPTPPMDITDLSRRRRGHRGQGPWAPERGPTVIQIPSRSSSRSRAYVPQPVMYQVETRRHATDATGQELESVISDFSSVVIIVCISLSSFQPPFHHFYLPS